jgi:hypothetical protein
MANGIGSSIGGTLGGIAGTTFGPIGTALGTAAGSLIGAGIEAIPGLIETDAEKENKRRLAQLKRMQEAGTLGLTEAEKQQLYTSAQGAAAGQMRQAQTDIRAAGAALGGSGAGTEALRQAQLAEGMTAVEANISQNVEAQNLQRKRELEDEIQGRIAAKSETDQARVATAAGIVATGVQSFSERLAQEQTIQGKAPSASELTAVAKLYGVDESTAGGLIEFLGRNPDAAKSIGNYLSLSTGK